MEGVATKWTWRLSVGVGGTVIYHHDITIPDDEMRDAYWEGDPDGRPMTRYRFLRNTVQMLASQMEVACHDPSTWEWTCSLVSVS